MIEFKQSTQIRVPVRLLTNAGLPVPGVLFSAVTVSIEKADGTTVAYTPTNLQWIEVTFGAFLNQGKYDLIITSGFTDQTGPFIVAVAAAGANTFIGAFKIISYESLDIYNNVSTANTTLTSFQSDFDTWKAPWTSTRAGYLDNLVPLLKINTGKWAFNTTGPDVNKFVIYDSDNTTPLYKFFLYGSDGITFNFITPYFRVPTT